MAQETYTFKHGHFDVAYIIEEKDQNGVPIKFRITGVGWFPDKDGDWLEELSGGAVKTDRRGHPMPGITFIP